jgi:hypothetical protein
MMFTMIGPTPGKACSPEPPDGHTARRLVPPG